MFLDVCLLGVWERMGLSLKTGGQNFDVFLFCPTFFFGYGHFISCFFFHIHRIQPEFGCFLQPECGFS